EIREKERIYLEAFEKAGEELKSYREDPRYRESFTRILRESLDGIQAKDIEVHIDPRDAELCFQALKAQESKFQLVTDLHSIGGHIIRIPDGSITIDNTIESRILQAREVLKKEIYSILFG
ncbi:MAG TPA: V-type ATP synthase subunit E, partial [Methanoregulaceae archaeon]|nr:V-type ATP synthase subunit E [Methanoregulaceae archaeon]